MSVDPLRRWRPRSGEWSRAAATHLLRRVGFGAAPGEVDALLALDPHEAVACALERDAHDERIHEGIHALLPTAELDHLASWWASLVLAGGAPLRERVTLMWHDHFATSHAKVGDVRLMHRQNELFRAKGLGDFRSLLHEVARDPAMLVWLDGDSNRRGHPNENFARELLELFALGIGHYGERDVLEAARAFTGCGTDGRSFVFREDRHDPGEKEVLGRRGRFGADEAIDVVLAHPACARRVAYRLLEELVAPTPDEAWVEATARRLLAHDWDVRRTIEDIVRSTLFFSPETRRSRIAAPLELMAMSARAVGARVAPRRVARASAEMGQALFRPPSVKGWDGMRAWIDAGTWVARHNALHDLAFAHVEEQEDVRVDLREAFPDAERVADVSRVVVRELLPELEGGALEEALGAAARGTDDLDGALALVTALVLTSPEYQRT